MYGKVKDGFQFFSKLTFRKVLNIGKITSSYYVSKLFKRPVIWGIPVSLSIEPTTNCNLRCPECPSGLRSFSRATGTMNVNLFKNLLDDFYLDLSYLLFYFQGEPYLHPEFTNLVKYAVGKGVYTATSTNAHFLNDENAKKTVESGLDRLIISIDGTTQESYQTYRKGGDIEKVISGTKNIVRWKKLLQSNTPHLIFQFLVVRQNQHQINEIKNLGKELGVDEVRFKTAQIYDFQNGSPLIPTINKYSRYERLSDGKYKIKNKLSNHCWKLWHSPVVTWDGNVVPCCFDKDAKHKLGNVALEPFAKVWKNGKYSKFRKEVLLSRSNIDICKNCTEGTKVWA